MQSKRVLIDIGSTYTKVVVVDAAAASVVAAGKAPTTADTDVRIGLGAALRSVGLEVSRLRDARVLACSSAAGGLRMVSIGLVPELSAEAARRAALGAGAKVVGQFHDRLTRREVSALHEARPDIVLLSGGTDGGNERAILHNAQALAEGGLRVPIVVAGNKTAYDAIERVLHDAGCTYRLVDNVMPEIGRLEVDACREAIREVFIENIVRAKGLDEARASIGDIVMPTPVAVLQAAALLARGVGDDDGLGDLVVVDVGGATTDVCSMAHGAPTQGRVQLRGLPEPWAKRTVEGDLGVRHNIDTLQRLARSPLDARVLEDFRVRPERLALDEAEREVDVVLARTAVEAAFARHVGKLQTVYGPHGEILVQTGKDLSRVAAVVGTGGPIVHCADPAGVLRAVLATPGDGSLKPTSALFLVDAGYRMYAAGLLAMHEPPLALQMLRESLVRVG